MRPNPKNSPGVEQKLDVLAFAYRTTAAATATRCCTIENGRASCGAKKTDKDRERERDENLINVMLQLKIICGYLINTKALYIIATSV